MCLWTALQVANAYKLGFSLNALHADEWFVGKRSESMNNRPAMRTLLALVMVAALSDGNFLFSQELPAQVDGEEHLRVGNRR